MHFMFSIILVQYYELVGWLVGWYYDISTFVGLCYAEFTLTIMISDYIQYNYLYSQSLDNP